MSHTQRSADELVPPPDEVMVALFFWAFTTEVVKMHLLDSLAISLCPSVPTKLKKR